MPPEDVEAFLEDVERTLKSLLYPGIAYVMVLADKSSKGGYITNLTGREGIAALLREVADQIERSQDQRFDRENPERN